MSTITETTTTYTVTADAYIPGPGEVSHILHYEGTDHAQAIAAMAYAGTSYGFDGRILRMVREEVETITRERDICHGCSEVCDEGFASFGPSRDLCGECWF